MHMRERAHGESKLQGKKAVKLVLTVVGTLLFFRLADASAAREHAARRRARLLGRRTGRAPPGLRGPARARCRGRRPATTSSSSPGGRACRTRTPRQSSCAPPGEAQAREVVVDPDARTTVGNMANALNDVLRVGAKRGARRDVVVARTAGEGGDALAAPLDRDPRPCGVAAGAVSASRAPRAAALAAAAVPAVGGGAQELGAVQGVRLSGLVGLKSDTGRGATPPPRGSAPSPRVATLRFGRRGRRGSRRGSTAPSPPACRRRCRGRTAP